MHVDKMKELIIEKINCTENEASKIIQLYEKLKLIRHDPYTGCHIKHGIFWDEDVLQNALNEITDQPIVNGGMK